jgi:hypothetical protein
MVWSFSRLSAYLTCGLQYYLKYCAQVEPTVVSSNLLLGSGVHYAHQLIYENMAKHGRPPSLQDVLDGVNEEMRLRHKISPPVQYKNGGDLEALVKEAQTLTETLYGSVTPEPVVSVDQTEIVDLIDGQGYPLGKLQVVYDLIVGNGEGETETIVDLKTAKQQLAEDRLRWDLQPSCYLLARKLSTGRMPGFRFDVLLKRKVPEFSQHPVARSQSDFDRLLGIIRNVDRGIREEVFMPHRGCISCSSCGWEQACSAWTG